MIRLVQRTVLACLTMGLAACGQVDPAVIAVSMPDCIYQGPSSMSEGDARISLTLTGLADSGVSLVELTGEETYDDLVDHFETVDDRWIERPRWVSTVLELRLDSSLRAGGVEETTSLDAGRYALVCIDHPYDESQPTVRGAAPLEVKDS